MFVPGTIVQARGLQQENGNATVAWFWLIVASSGSQIAVSLLKMGQS